MRTNMIGNAVSAGRQFAEQLLVAMERNYHVNGEIVFKLCGQETETDQEFLKCAIVQVAGNFPWKDTMLRFEEYPFGGMHRPFDGFKKVNNGRVPEIEYWFTINPCRADMMKSQLHAYEKHLTKLAQELSLMKLANICEVRSIINISRMDIFKVVN